jgi:flagellar FliL protein
MAEEKEENQEEQEGGKKGGNKLVIIIVAVVLVVLIVVGVVVMMLLGGDEEEGGAKGAAPAAQQAAAPAKKGAGAKRVAEKVYTTVGPMHELKRFTVNLLTDSGRKYLRTTLTLELDSPDLVGELGQKDYAIRDVVINILTSKTFEEISTTKGKDRLKDELVETLNQSLVDGQIKNVFFTEFVVQ